MAKLVRRGHAIKKALNKLAKSKKELQVKLVHIPQETKNIHVELPQKDIIEAEEIERIEFPKNWSSEISPSEDILSIIRSVNESYPLITMDTHMGPMTLASANIKYNTTTNELNYTILEPVISSHLAGIIKLTKKELHDDLDVDFSKIKLKKEAYQYIDKKIEDIWRSHGIYVPIQDALKIKYYLFRDIIGLSKIDPILQDTNIEDISCDGVGLPIYVYHRNPIYGEMETNIIFSTKEELDSFVMRLAQKCNRTISVASPLMDGSLPDGSRVQITYGTDIARKGSNFTIRKFFRVPLTPIDLMNFGTINSLMLAYLWLAIEFEKSILISGTTAVGKTTMLNALSMFIEPNLKIVSIEDTPELQLLHTNWMPQVTRSSIGVGDYGEVSMYDLLRAALRQRPDYLIVGEVRGREASVLFQAMATGHSSLSTLHADTMEAVIDRLTTRPIDLPESLLNNLDVIIFLEKSKRGDKALRKVGRVVEIEGYDTRKKGIKKNNLFKWIPSTDKFESNNSYILANVAKRLGWDNKKIQEEILRRANVLEWMRKKGISQFRSVAQIISMYYNDPQRLASIMKQ